jgi:hypothetical protein
MKSLQEENKELINYDIFGDSAKTHTAQDEEEDEDDEEEDPFMEASLLRRCDTSFRQQQKHTFSPKPRSTLDRRNLAQEDEDEDEEDPFIETSLQRRDSAFRQEHKKTSRWEGGCSSQRRQRSEATMDEPVQNHKRQDSLASSPVCPKRQVSITPTENNDGQIMADYSRMALLVIAATPNRHTSGARRD